MPRGTARRTRRSPGTARTYLTNQAGWQVDDIGPNRARSSARARPDNLDRRAREWPAEPLRLPRKRDDRVLATESRSGSIGTAGRVRGATWREHGMPSILRLRQSVRPSDQALNIRMFLADRPVGCAGWRIDEFK
jgi:hypothetical protein